MGHLGAMSATRRALDKQLTAESGNGSSANTAGFDAQVVITKAGRYSKSGSNYTATNVHGGQNMMQVPTAGSSVSSVSADESAHDFTETGVPTHMMIEGEGYFMTAKVKPGNFNDDDMHTVPATDPNTGELFTADHAAAEYNTLIPGAAYVNGDFVRADDEDYGVCAGGDHIAVVPVVGIPLSSAAGRVNYDVNGAGRSTAAPTALSGDGLATQLTKVCNASWDSVRSKYKTINQDAEFTDSRLVMPDGSFVVGWVNENLNHPTNKKPQWENGQADVACRLDRAQAASWMDDAHHNRGLVKVELSEKNACIIRIPNLKDYAGVHIEGNGDVVGTKEGVACILAKVLVVKVDSPNALMRAKDAMFEMTKAAGKMECVVPGQKGTGEVEAGRILGSNSDISRSALHSANIAANLKVINGFTRQAIDLINDDARLLN